MKKYKVFKKGKIYKFCLDKYIKDTGSKYVYNEDYDGIIVTPNFDYADNNEWATMVKPNGEKGGSEEVHRDWCKVVKEKSNDN